LNVVAVSVDNRGKIGALLEVAIAASYSGSFARLNNLGFVAAPSDANAIVAGREKAYKLGDHHPDGSGCLALASDSGDVAWVSQELRICAAVLSSPKPSILAPDQAPKLEELPDTLIWSADGSALVIGYESGRWAWAKRIGA
jgi:hypothetical protein